MDLKLALRGSRALTFLTISLCLMLISCQGLMKGKDSWTSTSSRERVGDPLSTLTEKDAIKRAELLSDVQYDLYFDITGAKFFKGVSKIDFSLKEKTSALRVDFGGGEISKIYLNGVKLDRESFDYNGHFVQLDLPEFMKAGAQRLAIHFKRAYSTDGAGLHRFVDPKDGKVYMYSDFEPYDANKMFPSFDQPDLKANYRLQVKAPQDFEVITSVREKYFVKAKEGKRKYSLWTFPWSERFSTYIFSLHAGPYKIWKDQWKDTPLRVYARQSLAQHVEPSEWFDITKRGMEYFEDYFGQKYPYGKYDQLIVPEFNSGAMENVGAVTFHESYIFRVKPTLNDRERRASVILHELAHMWFGNLVTMKWWNGLWLNESFATFMSNMALYHVTEFKLAWQSFFTGSKNWAYWTDQLVTTHPIEVAVPSARHAFSQFDGITYGKGASVLKQLHFLVGDEVFKKGIQYYFRKHRGKNTELSDFFEAIEWAKGGSLEAWNEKWVQRAGLNKVQAQFKCDEKGEYLRELTLQQSAPSEHPTLREHRSLVALYRRGEGRIVPYEVLDTLYGGKSTSVSIGDDVLCPSMVFPNYEDYDYVKVELDQQSLKFLKRHLASFESTLDRAMLWQSLWQMVRDAKLNATEYAELYLKMIGREKDYKIAEQVSRSIYRNWLYYYNRKPQKDDKLQNLRGRLENFFWAQLNQAKAGSDFQKMWFQGFVAMATSDKAQGRLYALLEGKQVLKGLPMKQPRRWKIISQLSGQGFKGADNLRTLERARDKSDLGLKWSIVSEAKLPESKVKKKWVDEILKTKSSYSFDKIRSVMSSLFPSHQKAMVLDYKKTFFGELDQLAQGRDDRFLKSFVRSLSPYVCREKENGEMSAFLQKSASRYPWAMVKELKIRQQEDERCLEIVKLMN